MNKEMTGTMRTMLCALCIALNIVLGIITSLLNLPLYLDTIGTVFIAIYFGPWYGAMVGGSTNFLTSIFTSPAGIPFMLVSIVIGITVGYIFKYVKFTFVSALAVGLLLSFVSPLIGTPIGIAVYGGLTGTVSDVFLIFLKESGASIFAASFITKIGNNLIDKIGTLLLVYAVIKALPGDMKPACYVGTTKK